MNQRDLNLSIYQTPGNDETVNVGNIINLSWSDLKTYLHQLKENGFFPGQVDADDFEQIYEEICDKVCSITIMLELAVSFSFLFLP